MIFFELLYLASALALAVYGLNAVVHAYLYQRLAGRPAGPEIDTELAPLYPMVTVQLPVYNERHVVNRLLQSVAALDWPADRLQIQILDDSTDDTTQIIAGACMHLERSEHSIEHVRRPVRRGYKAGALHHGLSTARGEFIAIFDADFVPVPDFLMRTVPCFADATVGCVQTRWGHVNGDASQLTRAQALGIDGHFIVEQTTRHQLGAFLNFNGTAGVWRRTCMDAAGGWQGDTLTEDLDLSYRAQLDGWRIAYLPDVVVPAELPMQIDAFKRQQFRWAKGSLQTAKKLLGRVWSAPLPLWKQVQGTLHLTNYLVHPLMVLNLLLLLPIMLSNGPLLRVAFLLTSATVGPPLMYWLAMAGRPWSTVHKIGQLALLMAIGTGLSLNNTARRWKPCRARRASSNARPSLPSPAGRRNGRAAVMLCHATPSFGSNWHWRSMPVFCSSTACSPAGGGSSSGSASTRPAMVMWHAWRLCRPGNSAADPPRRRRLLPHGSTHDDCIAAKQ